MNSKRKMYFNDSDEPNPKRRKSGRLEKQKLNKKTVSQNINRLPDEVFKRILSKLDTTDLFPIRNVSKKFNKYSVDLIQNRKDAPIINFTYSHHENLYVQTQKKEEKDEDKPVKFLLEFTKCFKKSKLFTRFHFNHLNVSKTDLINFFVSQGRNVSTLSIEPPKHSDSVNSLRSVLKMYTHNIKEIIIGHNSRIKDKKVRGGVKYTKDVQLFPESNHGMVMGANLQPVLTKLTSIKVNYAYLNYQGVVGDILNAAGNLKEIRGPWEESPISVDDIRFLINYGKLDLVKQAIFDLEDMEIFILLMKYPYLRMKIKRLIFRCYSNIPIDPSIQLFFFHIMEITKDTLRHLELESFGYFPIIDWSWLENIEKFSFVAKQDPLSFFPGIKKDQLSYLSNIKEMDIKCILTDDANDEPQLEFFPVFPNVKKLSISAVTYNPNDTRSIAQMFPAATSVIVRDMNNFIGFIPTLINNMKQVEILQLDVPATDFFGSSTFNLAPTLDVICTGYCVMTVTGLREFAKGKHKISQEILGHYEREYSSIFDLPNLTLLKMNLYEHRCCRNCDPLNLKTEADLKSEMISDAARLFGYSLLPNLKVQIETEFRCNCCM